MTSRPGFKLATFAALAVLAGLPSMIGAQQVDEPARVLSGGEVGEDMDLSHLQSPFNLRAAGDRAVVGTRSNGQSANCITNDGHALYFTAGCASPQYTRRTDGGYSSMYFDLTMGWLAPPSDLPEVVDANESGLSGGGWTHNVRTAIAASQGGSDKVGPSDRGSELLAVGVQTTDDGDCTDFTGASNAFISAGFPILPVANCPQTHPPGGFDGRHLAEQEVYVDLFQTDPTFSEGDPFAFWRVPEELQQTERTIGDFHTYGEMNDYYFEALPRYGAVVPGQEGAPEYAGWPLGLEVFFDAFYWGLPTVGGTTYWMATIVNNSEEVYGVPVDYDSIYYALYYNPLLTPQESSQYLDTRRNAILHNLVGDGCTEATNLTATTYCPNRTGFHRGAAGIVVLKSPIGDMRYKQFSDPESDFFSPGHPLAGDTITIQHRHNCGFGGCYPNTFGRSQRAAFGLYSSTGANVLDGLAPSEFGGGDAGAYWLTFRDEDFPTQTGEFNKYVPGVDDDNGIWDYNHDGVPDTIYADDCAGRGCVGVWSDTLPGGHINYYGNISAGAIGPFPLAAGDTAGIILGFVGAADSAGIESAVDNTIGFYQNFFLGPEAAPTPTIVAVDTEVGSVDSASVTLFWNNATEDFVDQFLLEGLDVSTDTALNPWLRDSIDALALNNVAALHLFRSCDGGNSFSSDNDCDGDPIDAEDAKFGGFGWEPYQTFEAVDGELPNTFTDNAITAGIEYTYVLVSETVGAEFNVVRGEEGDLQAETVTFAPKLLSSLSASTSNPNVAVAYVPVNLAGGAERAQVEVLGRTGFADVPIDISLVGSAPEGGTFRTVFVDSVVVQETETISDGQVTDVTTTVRGLQIRTDTEGEVRVINEFTFTRSGDVAMSGLTEEGTDETATERVTTFAGGQAMILVDEDGSTPLLASTTLTGEEATPGGFIGREDFPFFSLEVDVEEGGEFDTDFYVDEDGDTLLNRVEPSVGRLSATEPLDGSQFGTYQMTFAGAAFGPLAPFAINQPETAEANFEASIQQRQTASQTTTDPAAIEAVNEAAGLSLSAEDAVAFNLPFSVQNVSYGRTVQVVMAEHQESITLGQGLEAVTVDVPGNNWIPGDELYFVEQVEREVTDEDGQTVIENGQPVTETAAVATFKVVLGCTTPRSSCDPTFGGSTPSGYNTLDAGTDYFMRYLVPFTGGEEFRFRLDPAVQLTDVEAVSDGDLANVHVVPNPYIFASAYERATADRVLKFTNLPPAGTLRIYDIAGRFVQEIAYTEDDLQGQGSQGGDLDWDLTTREGLELSYGLYVFVLESEFGSTMGKFVVIR